MNSGMAIGMMGYFARQGRKHVPSLTPFDSATELVNYVQDLRGSLPLPKTVIIGAKGAAGKGASAFYNDFASVCVSDCIKNESLSEWDMAETSDFKKSRPATVQD